jgi:hypothetical protein
MPTNLDSSQVIQNVYDEPNNRLRVDASLSASSVTLVVAIDQASDSILVYGWDGTANQKIKTDSSGELQIDVLSSALPAGAATSANQTNKAQYTRITDGTDDVLVTAAGEMNVLETNSGAILTSLQIIDDWDESDRAKVNLIVGSAGVQGDTGIVTANTQRVVLATDIALPAGNNNIGDVDIIASKGTLTDQSGTTSGIPNTSTQIMAANATRKYLLIQNVSNVNMWINFTSAATTNQPSILLSAGSSFIMEDSFVSTEAINVISSSASRSFTAKEG